MEEFVHAALVAMEEVDEVFDAGGLFLTFGALGFCCFLWSVLVKMLDVECTCEYIPAYRSRIVRNPIGCHSDSRLGGRVGSLACMPLRLVSPPL